MLVKLLVITRLRSQVRLSRTMVWTDGWLLCSVARRPEPLQVMMMCSHAGRAASTASSVAALSGLSPERANDTTRPGRPSGTHASRWVRISPLATAVTGVCQWRCNQRALASPT